MLDNKWNEKMKFLQLVITLSFSEGVVVEHGVEQGIGISVPSNHEVLTKITELESRINFFDVNNQIGSDRCIKICSENLENRTVWRQYGQDDKTLFAEIDISRCGFIRKPTLGRFLLNITWLVWD